MTAHRRPGALVGARSRAMLSLVSAFGAKSFQSKSFQSKSFQSKSFQSKSFQSKSFQSKSFRLPLAAELLSLCVAKEKVTQEKGHPASAPCGHPARKVRVRATGFVDRASCPDDKLAGIPAGHPAGFSFARPPLQRGPRVERRASCAHSSEEPDQEQGNSGAAFCCGCCFSLHHRVRARMARCSTRGPLRGGEAGSTGRAAGVARDGNAFSRGQDARSKSPAPAHGLAGHGEGMDARVEATQEQLPEPGKRQAGCRFLLVTSLLDKQKRSNSGAAGARKLLALKTLTSNEARASRTSALLQAQARQLSTAAAAKHAIGTRA